MASLLDCYNLALTNLDLSVTVKSINDNSPAAGVCNRYYDFARKRVLEKAHWGFATKMAALALLLDQSTVTTQAAMVFPGFRYVYAKPTDCLRGLAVTTQYGIRLNPFTRSWWYDMSQAPQWGPFRPPWREALDVINPAGAGNAVDILTDQDNAWFVYVTDATNVNLWTQAFMDCVAWHLSVRIAGPLSANQVAKQNAIKMAKESLTDALLIDLNEQQPDPYPDSPAITARN
jgi:hypothetical protein